MPSTRPGADACGRMWGSGASQQTSGPAPTLLGPGATGAACWAPSGMRVDLGVRHNRAVVLPRPLTGCETFSLSLKVP